MPVHLPLFTTPVIAALSCKATKTSGPQPAVLPARWRPTWRAVALGVLGVLGMLGPLAVAAQAAVAVQVDQTAALALTTLPVDGAATSLPLARRGTSVDPSAPNAQGALLYHNYCSVCHGDRGDGRSRATGALSTPPRDFTSALARQELSRERIVRAVTYGRPGTAMVAWTSQLSANDIERVADYVLTRFVHGSTTAAAAPGAPDARTGLPAGHPAPARATDGAATLPGPATAAISGTQAHGGREIDQPPRAVAPGGTGKDMAAATPGRSALALVPASAFDPTLPLPLGLSGKLQRGASFYRANCVACHGPKGDGQGPRAYFINPPPRNFIDPAMRSRLNRPLLFAAIHAGRLGTEMPAWSKVASDQQIADVAEYVFQTFVLGSTAPGVAAKP